MPMRDEIDAATAAGSMPPLPRFVRLLLLGLLVLLGLVAGLPRLGAPWILGDEFIFIVNNPDVTGDLTEDAALSSRVGEIFAFPPREDLYQPLPILTYAAQWALWGNDALVFRLIDVLLHIGNGVLLWWVLSLLLARFSAGADGALRTLTAWSVALLWTLHPANVNVYAADMGRTHLLSAGFILLAAGLHLISLRRGRGGMFVLSWLALCAAELSKAVVGWFIPAFAFEAAARDGRRAALSPRVLLIFLTCAAFGALAYWTSLLSGIAEDAAAGLFGDPISRSLLAIWLYARAAFLPLWLSPWHPPDPATNWANPAVYLGLLLAALSAWHAVRAWRVRERRAITIGWIWFWATLGPVLGFLGVREAAITDRFLYLPLAGLALVGAGELLPWLARRRVEIRLKTARDAAVLAGLVSCAMLLWDMANVRMYRSTLDRGRRIAELYPEDPRAMEALAVAYDFAANHPILLEEAREIPRGENQLRYFLQLAVGTLRAAASVENLEHYFPGPADRAPFHRRLSYRFKTAHAYSPSLREALRAKEIQPDHFLTWVRLAHAYQGLGRLGEAIAAYERCEALLPQDPETRAAHFTDFGWLLLADLERAEQAYPKFQAAVATGAARALAYIGLARCEVRVGEGARGRDLVLQVLQAEPRNALAGLVLAEYEYSSHHFDQARALYALLIDTYPENYQNLDWFYEALRGFQGVCAQTGHWREAAYAWEDAVALHPESTIFRAFQIWSLACLGDERTPIFAQRLLEQEPNNRLCCLSMALHLCGTGLHPVREESRGTGLHPVREKGSEAEPPPLPEDPSATQPQPAPTPASQPAGLAQALDWVDRARQGPPIPRARSLERAATTMLLMRERGELPAASALVEAACWAAAEQPIRARAALTNFREQSPDAVSQALLKRVERELPPVSDPAATQPKK